MNPVENETMSDEKPNTPSTEEVFNYLLAVGANSCHRSYDAESKGFYQQFVSLPLTDVLSAWERYDNTVKTNIIDNNIDDLRVWVASRGGK